MNRAISASLVAGIIWALTAGTSAAAEEKEKAPAKTQTYGVIVGIGKYDDTLIKERKHTEADAKAMHAIFSDPKHVDVEKDNVKLLLGKDATKERILKDLHAAIAAAGKDDMVVFGYFGQGAPIKERTCFLAADSTIKDRDKNALAGAEIEHELEKVKKGQRLIAMIDINFKGFDMGKEAIVEPNWTDLYKVFMGGDEDKEDHTPPAGRLVFLANNCLNNSVEMEKNSTFATVLREALSGKADTESSKEGYEADGLITVDELVAYLAKRLPELTREHGKTTEEKEQTHFIIGRAQNHYPVTRNPAQTEKVKERLEKFAKIAEDAGYAKEIREEGDKFLARMPKLKAHQELRKNLQELADNKLTAKDYTTKREEIYKAMQLKRADAMEYAARVLQGSTVLLDGYVKELNQGDLVDWAVKGLYRRVEEKVPEGVKEKLKNVKTMSENDLGELLSEARRHLGKREDLDDNQDVDISLHEMMFNHLDPYTTYIDAKTLEEFKKATSGSFTGIGVQIRRDAGKDMLRVVTPLKSSPAHQKGLKAGDIITKIIREVDSKGNKLDKPETISTKGLALNDAVSKILGQPGTEVEIEIEREGVKEPIRFKITRASIQLESVLGHVRKDNDEWDFMIDPTNKIGYIRITSFNKSTFKEIKKAMESLAKDEKDLKGLILDLRNNPGGLLQSAVDISDMYIDDGLIVSIKPRVGGRSHSFTGEHEESHLKFPMVCLVNGNSASGSEIVSACLQDHNRAVIMGERSYGKGSVQNIVPFKPTKGEIKLTTASFWRPNGKNLNKSSTKGKEDEEWGVRPDKGFTLPMTRKERDDLLDHHRDIEIIPNRDLPVKDAKAPFKDKHIDAALEYLNGQIKTAGKVNGKKEG